MNKTRLLLIGCSVSVIAFLISVGLLEYHRTFDPYSWALPGRESDFSRSLWLRRRDLYTMMMLISFGAAVALGIAALLSRRRKLP